MFLAGAWQDEQTGPGFASILDKFDRSPTTKITVYNGVHPDGFQPKILTEWFNFLSLYVAEEIPVIPEAVSNLAPLLFDYQFGDSATLPDGRFDDYTDIAQALAIFTLPATGAGDQVVTILVVYHD